MRTPMQTTLGNWLSVEIQARPGWGFRLGSGSGRAEESECLHRCSGRCPGGQAEMSEDVGDHGGVFNGGDDFQRAAAVRAFFNIDIEHPFEQPGPADAGRRPVVGWVTVNLCSVRCVDR